MFIRPVRSTARPVARPPGSPLLRGLLRTGVYVWGGGGEHRAPADPSDAPAPPVAPVVTATSEPWPTWPPRGAGSRPAGHLEAWPIDPAAPGHTRPVAPPISASGSGAGLAGELERLAALSRAGLLTPQEFSAAKARVLRGQG
ncbi:hypothetical protein [Streptomyces sp. NPDC006879]|uniref:hypothetical protein n=1 Tax=Streptomyces sp. NPDC006879 TaxID=3364767 RepID=UPI0036A23F65